MRAEFQIETAADLDGVQQVVERVGELVVSRPPDVAFVCELAVTEACANVVEHAYAGRTDGRMRVVARLRAGHLALAICDAGPPFNPECRGMPPADSEGGRGVPLLGAIMDRVTWRRVDGENRLLMVRRLVETAG